jgi:hypothetical protein
LTDEQELVYIFSNSVDFEEFMSEKPPIIGLAERLEESDSDESSESDDDDDDAT